MRPDPPRFASPSVTEVKESILRHLRTHLLSDPADASSRDWWFATCLAARDWTTLRMGTWKPGASRQVYYLSLEYLMGRLMLNNLINTGLYRSVDLALAEFGQDLAILAEEEPDMGLGNGGLGRLAACFLDSLATLDLPATGYGIFYEFGLFQQEFKDGRQVEQPDAWKRFGNPWSVVRPELSVTVGLYGRVEDHPGDAEGSGRKRWSPGRIVVGVPWDILIVGYGSHTVNRLRLWESKASHEFDLATFDRGDYIEAVREKAESETISKVLYPNDSTSTGKELRLVQQYFFVACSLQDLVRRHVKEGHDWDSLPGHAVIQLNDTHPSVAILELMRIMVDESAVPWERAWDITRRTFAYTNHTLLPEALETWTVELFSKVLPRHLQIAERINEAFLAETVEVRWPGNHDKKRILSLFEEGHAKSLRMAHLAVLGSFSTNGVAAMHTRLLKARLFPEFDELFPERFSNKTNGITPRRWLHACNPGLSGLICEAVGDGWVGDLDRLLELEPFAEDASFLERVAQIKLENKVRLARVIADVCGVQVDPSALFDVQIKRLHEYKRQHLNLLHILALYQRLRDDPTLEITPRVFVFAAKAAPGYRLAKDIILAINRASALINQDPRIRGLLKIAFLPNYGVSLAERIIPAADLSEQISTAGKEASGTGNMKLALNGALTIGTLDGANVEILEAVGLQNIFIFGRTVEEIAELRAVGYRSWDRYEGQAELRRVIDLLASPALAVDGSHGGPSIRHSLLEGGDPFLVLEDFADYVACQDRAGEAFQDGPDWTRRATLNIARVGRFSSDRTVREYAREIWRVPVPEPQRIGVAL